MFTLSGDRQGNINLHYSVPVCSITGLSGEIKGSENFYKAAAQGIANGCAALRIKKSKQANKKSQTSVSSPGQNEHLFSLRAFILHIFNANQVGHGWDFSLSLLKGEFFNHFFTFDSIRKAASEKYKAQSIFIHLTITN